MTEKLLNFCGSLMMMIGLTLFSPTVTIAQNIVTGTVVDSSGEPIIGATVTEQGFKNGVATDINGNFSLKLNKTNSKLLFSYVGMESETLQATPGKHMTVTLNEDKQVLEDVVVVGYASKARKDLTGSVGSVSGAKLAYVPVASAAEALQGKISGVQVTTIDGQPGAEINIRVRGATSVTQSNKPLFIIDGFEADNIDDIPPTDIASIDILKDASLAAIYGAKGANGVIIVTTKSAHAGKIQVSFNGRLSAAHISKKLDLLDAYEFTHLQYDRSASNGMRSSSSQYFRYNFGNPNDLDLYKRATTYDWQKEVMGETPINYMANVTFGGGSDKIKFNTSITMTDDKGIIMSSGVRRTNINFKLKADLSNNLTLTYNPRMTYRRDIGAGGKRLGTGTIADVLRYRPTNGLREFAFWDPNTIDVDIEANFEYTNPKNDIQINQIKKHSYTLVNQIALDWKPVKWLTLHTEAMHTYAAADNNSFWGRLTSEGLSNNRLPLAQIRTSHQERYAWTNTIAYNQTLKEKHNISLLLGQELSNVQSKGYNQYNRYFPADITAQRAWDNMNYGEPYQSTSSLSTPDRTLSFFGQASYKYNEKYLLSFTMRADGSTKFAPGRQWGYFPSVSAGWIVSEEPWMKSVKWINNMKIRAAIGMVGNNRIDNDMWRFLYSLRTTGGPGFGETNQYGLRYYGPADSKKFTNPEVKWETTTKINLAADISLFNNRLNITPEIYWNTTNDLLYRSAIITTTGYSEQTRNIGKVTNRGYELTVNGDILRGKDYVLSATYTMGFNKTMVKKLNETDVFVTATSGNWSSDQKDDYLLRVGNELGLMYGFVYDGLYSLDEFDYIQGYAYPKDGTVINKVLNSSISGEATRPGKIKFKDLDGDGEITAADRQVIGNTNPRFQGGFGLNGQWKNFDFNVFFNYMIDFDAYNATAQALSSQSKSSNTFYNVLSKFNKDSRWVYTREDGECIYQNRVLDYNNNPNGWNSWIDELSAMNEGHQLWSPADLINNVMFSYFVEDASFLRCNDLTIGYTLPRKLTMRWGISKLRLYASTSNLFIITNYSGQDPEVDVQSGLSAGMDYNRYPRNRAFFLGVNVNF